MTTAGFDMSEVEGAVDARLASPLRLAAVSRSGLLDTPPEEAFDALTRLAATLLRVPASFVSVVDEGRDFYKSQVGFAAPLAAARQLEGRTFCHYTLERGTPLVIADTASDPVWLAVPTVGSLGVRAYLGVPLRLDGETIGSLCVIDDRPRAWTATEIDILVQLALSAAREITMREALRESRRVAAALQAAARANEEVVATVSHDLRTPLQVMLLTTDALDRGGTAEQRVLTQRLRRAVDGMQRLANELLAASAAAVGDGGHRQTVALPSLLADAAETMQALAVKAGIRLQVGGATETEATIDYAQMLRVLCNLIGNAIKYCPSGSTVTLGVAPSTSADRVDVTVADDGPGFSAEARRQAFDRGWQGADGRARGDGAGLGLAIVRTLAERNGGTVELQSEPGRGATFIVHMAGRPTPVAATAG
jgi:signal transduction histidine kinase